MSANKMSRLTANLLLTLTAFIWGTAFVGQKAGMEHMGPFMFTSVRFLMGVFFLLPLAWWEWKKINREGMRLTKRDLTFWWVLGFFLSGGVLLQQIGVHDTTVTNAGFLTGLYVPMVPFLVWVFEGRRPHHAVWAASVACVVGAYLLSQGAAGSLSRGDMWLIASSFFWAAHVTYLGIVAKKNTAPILLACGQFLVCGILSLALALGLEKTHWQQLYAALPSLLYTGVASVSIAYTLQVIAQHHTRSTDVAIILSSEFLFAAIAGAVYYDERLTLTQGLGACLILFAILWVQLAPLIKKDPLTVTPSSGSG